MQTTATVAPFSTFQVMADAALQSVPALRIFAHVQSRLTPELLAAGFRIKDSEKAPAWQPVRLVRAGDQTSARTSLQAHDPVTDTAFAIEVSLTLLEHAPTRASILFTVKAVHGKPARVCESLPNASSVWSSASLAEMYDKACAEFAGNPVYLPPADQFEELASTLSTTLMP